MAMKTNIINSIVILLFSGLFVACSNNGDPTETTPQSKIVTISTDVTSSRVSYQYLSGLVPKWESNDQLTVYRGDLSATASTFATSETKITSTTTSSSASFTGTLNGTGSTLYAYVKNDNLSVDGTAKTVTENLSSQTGTLDDIKKYNLLTSTTAYNNESSISMSFGYKMAVLKLALTVPSTATISSLKLHASSGLYNKVVFDAAGTLQTTSTAGDISISGASWASGTDNQTTTAYACVYPGQLNDLYVYATDANNKVYSVKIGSKALAAGTVYPITNKTLATFVGSGTSDAPYQVGDESTLRLLSYVSGNNNTNYTSATFQQTKDITLAGKEWEPINNFTGAYNGNSKTVSGSMVFSNTAQTAYGLFGSNTSATIKGLTISCSVTLPSSNTVRTSFGAIAGDAISSTISDCTNTSTVSGSVSYMGGIVGYINGGTKITHCSNTGSLTNTSTWNRDGYVFDTTCNGPCIGGIVGDAISNLTNVILIEACSNTGTLTCSTTITYASAGGIVGYLFNTGNTSTTTNVIRGCYSTAGKILATLDGGLVGCINSNLNSTSISASNSVIVACWNSTKATNFASKSKSGSIVGVANKCDLYKCAGMSDSYYYKANTSSSVSVDCILLSASTPSTDQISDLNTAWNGANSSRIYQFNSTTGLIEPKS